MANCLMLECEGNAVLHGARQGLKHGRICTQDLSLWEQAGDTHTAYLLVCHPIGFHHASLSQRPIQQGFGMNHNGTDHLLATHCHMNTSQVYFLALFLYLSHLAHPLAAGRSSTVAGNLPSWVRLYLELQTCTHNRRPMTLCEC